MTASSASNRPASVDETLALVMANIPVLGTEAVPLGEALGRVLREPVCAPEDQPAFDRSSMDGYAVRTDDNAMRIHVVDCIRAGDWKSRQLARGEAYKAEAPTLWDVDDRTAVAQAELEDREMPGAYLLIVGEGSRLDALKAIAHEQRIERHVIFTGRRDDIPAVTAAFDVAVLPSYREAQGLTILEAMALSRPVVASRVGGIPEMITDGVTGLLVPPHDPPALAAAIVRLLRDHPLADVIGRAGHDLVHDRFCIQLMVNAVQALYDEGARAVRPREVVAAV